MAKKSKGKTQPKKKLTPAARRALALKQTSFKRIIHAVNQTEGHLRKFKAAPTDERSKELALAFLDRIRREVRIECEPIDDADMRNVPFSMAKRHQ